jgi:hypothetical protein
VLGLVALVGLQEDRDAGVGVDTAVDERQREVGLEGEHAVVGGGVGVLLPLADPGLADLARGLFVLDLDLAVVPPADRQGGQEQGPHDPRRPAEAAVAGQVEELLAGNPDDHVTAQSFDRAKIKMGRGGTTEPPRPRVRADRRRDRALFDA